MDKIELTATELKVLDEYFAGEIGMFTATEEQMTVIRNLNDRAGALMRKLDAWDELGEDMLGWYYNKYLEQRAQ